MSSGGEKRVPPLDLTSDPPLQIIVDGTQELMIGSPVPHPHTAHQQQQDNDEDSRSVSPCPSITVDECEGHNLQEAAEEEQEEEKTHMLSLPKRRHSDVSQSAVTYYKSSLLGSRSENVLYTFHHSLDIPGRNTQSGFLDLPVHYKDNKDGGHTRAIKALCSPETHRKNKHKSRNTSSAQDTATPPP